MIQLSKQVSFGSLYDGNIQCAPEHSIMTTLIASYYQFPHNLEYRMFRIHGTRSYQGYCPKEEDIKNQVHRI